MSYVFRQGGRQDYFYKEIVIDTPEDLAKVDTSECCPGSVVIVVSTGDIYLLNNKKEWVKQ